MKRTITLLLALIMMVSLCACGGNAKAQIDVKGLFLLEPSDELDFSEEGLDSVQRYLLVIYDVDNSGNDRNEELSSRSDSVTITLNGTNSYEQLLTSGEGAALKAFRENCGYETSVNYGTLWGGSEPIRMLAVFAVNGNDLKQDSSARISFDLSDDLNASVDAAGADIQTIGLLDEVFSVEEDPDAYQLIHSVKRRAEICKAQLEAASAANRNGDTSLRDLCLGVSRAMFSEDAQWGVSCCSYGDKNVLSDELPGFRMETISAYDAALGVQLGVVSAAIDTMIEALQEDTPDYDAINAAQRSAYATLNDVLASC